MKRLVLIAAIVLTGCSDQTYIPSYDELVKFRTSCSNKDAELKKLRTIQQYKNFAQDPDELSEEDRAYNSKLKSTIWWYTWNCHEKVLTSRAAN
jgi:hypothetical protein